MGFVIILIAAACGAVAGAVLMLVSYGLWWVVGLFGKESRPAGSRIVLIWPVTAVLLTVTLLYAIFWVPQQKQFDSPGGNLRLTLAFYPEFAHPLEYYRAVMTLKDARSGETLARARDRIRGVCVGGDEVSWDDDTIQCEWINGGSADDRVRAIFPDMNRAYLLPSGDEVSPLSESDPPPSRVREPSGSPTETAPIPFQVNPSRQPYNCHCPIPRACGQSFQARIPVAAQDPGLSEIVLM